MPSARCINCNRYFDFRNTRGSKISERRCQCGGSLELIGGSVTIAGENPFNPARTHLSSTGFYTTDKYWYAKKNRKGELFYIEYGWEFWKPVIEYELAVEAIPNV